MALLMRVDTLLLGVINLAVKAQLSHLSIEGRFLCAQPCWRCTSGPSTLCAATCTSSL